MALLGELLFHSVVGLLMLVGVTLGAVVVVIREIAKATAQRPAHDPHTCLCPACDDARRTQAKYQSGKEQTDRQNPPTATQWRCAAELEIGMIMISAVDGAVRRIIDIRYRPYGLTIILIEDRTKTQSWITVPTDRIHKKIFRTRRMRRRGR